jgi:dTDP-glucose pyrophosphorylase/CBS domain-containing protein
MHSDVTIFCVPLDRPMRDAIACLDASRLGIALIVSGDGKLEGTITDGDLRRFMMTDGSPDELIASVLERKKNTVHAHPITAPSGSDVHFCREVLLEHRLLHLPLVDGDDRVVGLVTQSDLLEQESTPRQAVIMAGGFGTRLHPLTEDTPKSMLPLGDRPLLEIIIGQLQKIGVSQVQVATHHQANQISDHFGDGARFGIDIAYVDEERPLGTAGALGRMERPTETLLVINGDILTDLDFRAMLAFHREQAADLTVAVRQYDLKLPYGVVECDGSFVRSLKEKPVWKCFVNAGIYLLEPNVYDFIPSSDRFDMTDLIENLIESERPVASFPIREYWLDIGQHADYQEAQSRIGDLESGS